MDTLLFTVIYFFAEQSSYLPFLNHTNTYVTSGSLQSCDSCASDEITLPDDFAFGKYIHQYAYVSLCNESEQLL